MRYVENGSRMLLKREQDKLKDWVYMVIFLICRLYKKTANIKHN